MVEDGRRAVPAGQEGQPDSDRRAVDGRPVTHHDQEVRITLNIDDDVLQTAREPASSRGHTTGRVISDLARSTLESGRRQRVRNGVPLLPRRPSGAPRPTMKLVNDLRDWRGQLAAGSECLRH